MAGPEFGELSELLAQKRDRVMQQIADPVVRRKVLEKLGQMRWAAVIRKQGVRAASQQMDEWVRKVQFSKSKGLIH